jgi:hypothetical protein
MKHDLDFYFRHKIESCSCSSFSVVKEKSMTTEWEERGMMVIIVGCVVVMVYCRVVVHS